MTELGHMEVRVIGLLPARVQAFLEQSQLVDHPDAPLALVWFADPAARAWLRGQDSVSAVALVDSPAAALTAIDDGALDAIVGMPDQLATRLRITQRVDQRWRDWADASRQDELRTSSELQSTRDLLSRLIDTNPCPVMAVDPLGTVVVFNYAAEVLLGYEGTWARENLNAREIYADPSDASRVLSAIRASPSRLVRDMPMRLRNRAGEVVPIRLNAAEVYAADGLPVATIGVFLDRRGEESLRHRLEATTAQLIELEEHTHRVTASLSRVHLLNQPLNTSMMTVEMLGLTHKLEARTAERLDRVYGQLERMAHMIATLTSRHHRTPHGHQLLPSLMRGDEPG